ncbi:MAG: hypothetical protein AAGK77_13805 [Pseudomonadota bacterium]
MPSVPFTMRVDPALKSALEEEAQRGDTSASQIATQAIRAHLEAQAAERAAIAAAIKEADKGRFITHDAMSDWIASWDSDGELPPPKAR